MNPISSYRLGDLVFLELNEQEKNEIMHDYPTSIGTTYIIEKISNPNKYFIDIITEIALDYCEHYSDKLPNDIEESTVIHLRLGDVVAGNEWHEISKRPVHVHDIYSLLINDTNNKYIIGKPFFAKTSSTNFQECIDKSNEYLNHALLVLDATHFDGGNADIDLCCAVKAKTFVKTRGFFSHLIFTIREKLGKHNILA